MEFESTTRFAYAFAQQVVIPGIAAHPSVAGGSSFKVSVVAQEIINAHLSSEQQATIAKRPNGSPSMTMASEIKAYAGSLSRGIYKVLGGGYFQLKTDELLTDEELDEALDDLGEPVDDGRGWVYAYSFEELKNEQGEPFPIKVGKTTTTVEQRIAHQMRAEAVFSRIVVLGQWRVSEVTATEKAIHNVLKARNKWRDQAGGAEWFNTTIEEVESILKFIDGE